MLQIELVEARDPSPEVSGRSLGRPRNSQRKGSTEGTVSSSRERTRLQCPGMLERLVGQQINQKMGNKMMRRQKPMMNSGNCILKADLAFCCCDVG